MPESIPVPNNARRIPPRLMPMVRAYFELVGPAFEERDRLEVALSRQKVKIKSLQDTLTAALQEAGLVSDNTCYTIDRRYLSDNISYAWSYDPGTAKMPPGDKVN